MASIVNDNLLLSTLPVGKHDEALKQEPVKNPAEALGKYTTQDEIAAKLHGKQLQVPNMMPFLQDFPAPPKSSNYDALVKIHDRNMSKWFPNQKFRDSVARPNVPLFVATWFPHTSLERQVVVMGVTAWLFTWDDSYDEASLDPSTPIQLHDILQLHRHTMNYIAYHFGLDGSDKTEPPSRPTSYSILFEEIGEFLRRDASTAQRRRLLREIQRYLDSGFEHLIYMRAGDLPANRGAYWPMRLGDSAALVYFAMTDYLLDISLPPEIFNTPEMDSVWFEAMRAVICVNDTTSFKKELKSSLCSLIPIMMKETGKDLPEVVDLLLNELQDSVSALNKAATSLQTLAKPGSEIYKAIAQFIDAIKVQITGNLRWSLANERYGIEKYLQEDGSLDIPL